MFLEGEPSSDNPVSAEGIASIPKDDDTDGSNQQQKSPDLEVPKDVQKDFYDFVEDNYDFYVPPSEKIIELKKYPDTLSVNFQTGYYEDAVTTTRINYRYHESRNINGTDYPAGFSRQNELMIHEKGFWTVSRYDVSPHINRGSGFSDDSNKAVYLSKGYGGRLDFFQVLDDQTLVVNYGPDGRLSRVNFALIEGEASLIDGQDEDDVVGTVPTFRGDSPLFLTLNSEDKVHYVLRDVGTLGEVVDLTSEILVEGRKVQIADTGDAAKIIYYRKDYPDKVDYEIMIPKYQRLVAFDTGRAVERYYEWEQDLIPEPLRRDPMMPPDELDDDWKRVDLAATIGIKIEKGLSS